MGNLCFARIDQNTKKPFYFKTFLTHLNVFNKVKQKRMLPFQIFHKFETFLLEIQLRFLSTIRKIFVTWKSPQFLRILLLEYLRHYFLIFVSKIFVFRAFGNWKRKIKNWKRKIRLTKIARWKYGINLLKWLFPVSLAVPVYWSMTPL